jgi:hypothetical protein
MRFQERTNYREEEVSPAVAESAEFNPSATQMKLTVAAQ